MCGEITNTCEEENIDAINADFTSSVRQNTRSEKELDNLRKHFEHGVNNRKESEGQLKLMTVYSAKTYYRKVQVRKQHPSNISIHIVKIDNDTKS